MTREFHLRFFHHRGEVDGAVAADGPFQRRHEVHTSLTASVATEQDDAGGDNDDNNDNREDRNADVMYYCRLRTYNTTIVSMSI